VKAAAGRALVRSRSGHGIGARRSGREAVGVGHAEAAFYRVGGGAVWPGDGGEWWEAVSAPFRRGSARVVVRSDDVGVLRPFWEWKGGAGRRHACT
jgi:hypothetical protein